MNLFTSCQSRGSHRLGHTALHCDRTCCFSLSLLRSAKLNRTCVFQTGQRPFLYFHLYFNVMYSLYNYLSASFYEHVWFTSWKTVLTKLLFILKMCLDFLTKPMLFANLCVCASFRIQSNSERKYWPIRFVHTHTRVCEQIWLVSVSFLNASCICIHPALLSVWGSVFTCKLHELEQQDWRGLCRAAV